MDWKDVAKNNRWRDAKHLSTITSKDSHYRWMYNNEHMARKTSSFDLYSWQIAPNKAHGNFIAAFDAALTEIAAIGRIGLIHPSHEAQQFVISRLNHLCIPYTLYYLQVEDIPTIDAPSVKIDSISSDKFEDYVREWTTETLSWRTSDAYFSYIADGHDGVLLHCNPPNLQNIKTNNDRATGPAYWTMQRSELDWANYRWAATKGKHVINPYKWTSELIALWLSHPIIANYIMYPNETFVNNTNYFTSDVLKHYNFSASPVNDPWKEISNLGYMFHLYSEACKIVRDITGFTHSDVAHWPLHRLAKHLSLEGYDALEEKYTGIYGKVQ